MTVGKTIAIVALCAATVMLIGTIVGLGPIPAWVPFALIGGLAAAIIVG